MGAQSSKQVEHRKTIAAEKKILADLLESAGDQFPGFDFRPPDHKAWTSALGPDRLLVSQIVWPGTHDSATDKIGIHFVSRPFAQCQSCSIYGQLATGARILDVRVQEDRRVCHGVLATYSMDVVIDQIKRFLSETRDEIIILEVRSPSARGVHSAAAVRRQEDLAPQRSHPQGVTRLGGERLRAPQPRVLYPGPRLLPQTISTNV